MHTRTFTVNKAVALAATAAPPAAAAAGTQGHADTVADIEDADTQQQHQQQQQGRQGSGPLKPLNGPSRTGSGGKASGGAVAGSQAGPKQSQPAYRPEKLVRTDHRYANSNHAGKAISVSLLLHPQQQHYCTDYMLAAKMPCNLQDTLALLVYLVLCSAVAHVWGSEAASSARQQADI